MGHPLAPSSFSQFASQTVKKSLGPPNPLPAGLFYSCRFDCKNDPLRGHFYNQTGPEDGAWPNPFQRYLSTKNPLWGVFRRKIAPSKIAGKRPLMGSFPRQEQGGASLRLVYSGEKPPLGGFSPQEDEVRLSPRISKASLCKQRSCLTKAFEGLTNRWRGEAPLMIYHLLRMASPFDDISSAIEDCLILGGGAKPRYLIIRFLRWMAGEACYYY